MVECNIRTSGQTRAERAIQQGLLDTGALHSALYWRQATSQVSDVGSFYMRLLIVTVSHG